MKNRFGEGFSEADRLKMAAFVEAHGISPNDVPIDAEFELTDDDHLAIEVMVRNADGEVRLDPHQPNQVLRTIRTVPQMAPLPQFEQWP